MFQTKQFMDALDALNLDEIVTHTAQLMNENDWFTPVTDIFILIRLETTYKPTQSISEKRG